MHWGSWYFWYTLKLFEAFIGVPQFEKNKVGCNWMLKSFNRQDTRLVPLNQRQGVARNE